MKIAIGLPITNRTVDRDFFLSFAAMEKPSEYVLCAPSHEIYDHAVDIAKARNGLVLQAIESKCDALIMMDTDQVYPEDTIIKLTNGLKQYDAVGAVVHRRYPPFNPLIMRGMLGKYKRLTDDECYGGDLVSIDATGCGCIAMRMSVFKKIKYPWFELKPNNGNPVGEDIRFCHRMKKAGLSLAVDTSVQIDHLTTFTVNRGIYELFKLMRGNHGNVQKRQGL